MVNVTIPVYKARETLPAALDSLVAQTRKMFVVTLSQDGDGEDYSDIIEEYRRRGLHIRLINSVENGGAGIARQRSIDASDMYDYLMFLDADDILMPRAIEKMYYEAKTNGVDILMSNFIAERKKTGDIILNATSAPITWMHNKIYSNSYLKRIGLRFPDGLRLNEDSFFNLVAVNCTKNIKRIDEVTYLWRDNQDSTTRKDDDFFKRGWEQYVLSQKLGILKIIEVTGSIRPSLLGATLCLVYPYTIKADYFGYDTTRAKELLHELGSSAGVREAMDQVDFWQAINEKLTACDIVKEQMIFYNMRFNEWLKVYMGVGK